MQAKTLASFFVVLFWLAMVVFAYFDQEYVPDTHSGGGYYTLTTLTITLIIFLWFRYDAKARNFVYSWKLRMAILLFGLFAVPFYLVKSRGWRGFAVAAAKFACLFIAVNSLVPWLRTL
ncbi:MAG TPA: hypothetical protein VFT66_00620 [Roseiflexaceae bacterium]|jgi:hypothetical protein|nr:hypothetical protein [Roseiflexaceae bacterium]